MNKLLLYKVLTIAGLLAVSAVLASKVEVPFRGDFDLVRGFALTFCASVALVAAITLPVSALAVLVLKRESPFLAGCVLLGGLYFSTGWTLIYLCPNLLPSVGMALRMCFPADQYFPDHPPLEMLEFARPENGGAFMVAHLYWTGVFALVGGLLAHPWEEAAPPAKQAQDAAALGATRE